MKVTIVITTDESQTLRVQAYEGCDVCLTLGDDEANPTHPTINLTVSEAKALAAAIKIVVGA